MRILIVTPYFYPETVGAGVWTRQLAADLTRLGNQVTVLTAFPSYPEGNIFPAYRGKLYQRETVDSVNVIRTATYATPSKKFWPRIAAFSSFCLSSVVGAVWHRVRADVVYAILPPLPIGISGHLIARLAGARLVVNVQDIYPDVAVALGVLKNSLVIRFFEKMEQWIYSHAGRIVVISAGFRDNLVSKGVHPGKIAIVPNWADPDSIVPGNRHNSFREELGVGEHFLVVYSGGLTHNSDLSPVLAAADALRNEAIAFAIVGDGIQKSALMKRAAGLGLNNLHFLPFQTLERYGEVLAAADATVVTLHTAAKIASVPSKVYKQMAAGRPVIAVAEPESELARLVQAADCGFCVRPADVEGLTEGLRRAIRGPGEFARFGANARAYLVRECSRARCVREIHDALLDAHTGQTQAAVDAAGDTLPQT